MKKIRIAIDGPAGSGKSTIARLVADRMEYKYLDTGAMYRAVAWYALSNRMLDCKETELENLVQGMKLVLEYADGETKVAVNGADVTSEIRSMEVTAAVSVIAQSASVRKALVEMQQQMSQGGGIVMDGRDIGTVVLPDAELKVFLTASAEERTRRRLRELGLAGKTVNFDELKASIAARDYTDSHREISPLRQAEDAILLDTTTMTITEVCTEICRLCEDKC